MNKKIKINPHAVFFAVVLVLFIFAIVKFLIWHKGEDSGYDPNEVSTEFDVETMDHIQPMDSSRFANHEDDGVTTLLCLGNSPFSDNKGENGLAQSLAGVMNGQAYDGSFADSFQSLKYENYSDSYPEDGVSLYHVVEALCSGDFSVMDSAAAQLGDEALSTVSQLKALDMESVDMLVIMYDLSDYIDLRPLYDANNENNLLTWSGSLNASLELLEETYPHIRTVVLSMPACGKTVDDFYVDGDIQNLGNGTLPDYLNIEMDVILANGVSYIDNYYGVITTDDRDTYLVDDYHLNQAGIQAIADRFAYFFADMED
jgi:hypothetical protein